MCQDERVFTAMMMAGTPCPYEGKIGDEAKTAWEANADERPDKKAYLGKITPSRAEKKAEKARLKKLSQDKKAEDIRIANEKKAEEKRVEEEAELALEILEQQEKNEAAKLKAEGKSQRKHLKQLEEAKQEPYNKFIKQCVGSAHTVESAKASGSKRAKEGVRKSKGTCIKEWNALQT
jgi:hypothetical protein